MTQKRTERRPQLSSRSYRAARLLAQIVSDPETPQQAHAILAQAMQRMARAVGFTLAHPAIARLAFIEMLYLYSDASEQCTPELEAAREALRSAILHLPRIIQEKREKINAANEALIGTPPLPDDIPQPPASERTFNCRVVDDALDSFGIHQGDRLIIARTDDLESGDLVCVECKSPALCSYCRESVDDGEGPMLHAGALRFDGTDELILDLRHPSCESLEFAAHQINIRGRVVAVRRNEALVRIKYPLRPFLEEVR